MAVALSWKAPDCLFEHMVVEYSGTSTTRCALSIQPDVHFSQKLKNACIELNYQGNALRLNSA